MIRTNQPLSEERYRQLVAEAQEVHLARVRASQEDVKNGPRDYPPRHDEVYR